MHKGHRAHINERSIPVPMHTTRGHSICVLNVYREQCIETAHSVKTRCSTFFIFRNIKRAKATGRFFLLGGDWLFFSFIHHKCYEFYLKMVFLLIESTERNANGLNFSFHREFCSLLSCKLGQCQLKTRTSS